uniref:HECT domain-containing protein n=1 Tax=Magallana gigas TaxID=29159 RepID=A0A8W8NRB8_MAGGI
MAGNEDDMLKEALFKANLQTLHSKFLKENIDFEIAQNLSDGQLSSLGVATIGERHKLRNALRDVAVVASKHQDPEPGSNIRSIQIERSRLFTSGKTRTSVYSKTKNKKPRTWTATFICLADRNQMKVPTSMEREVLFKAGLGYKKIQLCEEDKEDDMMEKLTNENNFYQLKNIGGFELLRCKSNCRELCAIDCPWTVSDLKAAVGSQAKIYIRPIQRSLSLKQTQPQKETTRKEKCKGCKKEYPINDLRNHVKYCFLSKEFPESDEEQYELPDPFGEENITNLYNIQMNESLQTPLDAASEMQLSQVTEHRSNWLPPAASVPVQPSDRNLRPCLEVQFYGESAVDLGGPRKEFFALVLREIKEMYFNPVKEWTPSSYEAVGKILEDGTEVEDDDVLEELKENTFMALADGEEWTLPDQIIIEEIPTLPTLPSLQAIQEPELIAENENDNEMSLPTKVETVANLACRTVLPNGLPPPDKISVPDLSPSLKLALQSGEKSAHIFNQTLKECEIFYTTIYPTIADSA